MSLNRISGWGKIVCPNDQGRLDFYSPDGVNGKAVCQLCKREYPIVDGILSFNPGDNLEFRADVDDQNALERELAKRNSEAVSGKYDEVMGSPFMYACEVLPAIDMLRINSGIVHSDLGCGTGRATLELAHKGIRVIGIDFSLASLRVCQAKARAKGVVDNICLVHGDICSLPFAAGSLERAISLQVYSQLPSVYLRDRAFGELSRVLSSDGKVVITVYNYSIYKRLARVPRDWRDSDGLEPFHHFTADELRRELSQNLQVTRLIGIVALPARTVGDRLREFGLFNVGVGLSQMISRTPLSRYLGGYLLAECCKKQS